MRRLIALLGMVGFAAALTAKTYDFDAGAFTVSLDATSELWTGQSWPKFNTLHLVRYPGAMVRSVAEVDCYVYVDRISDRMMPRDLVAWFAGYVKQPHGFLDHLVFNKRCRFEPARDNPKIVGDYTLYELDMQPRSYLEHGATVPTIEHGVVYFLILPGIEKHRTFFVFTGREALFRGDTRRPSLGIVLDIVRGFRLTQIARGK